MHRIPLLSLLLLIVTAVPVAAETDDYIAGYATGMLERDFQLAGAVVSVQNGAVTVLAEEFGPRADPVKILEALQRIPGVVRVDVGKGDAARRETLLSSPAGSVSQVPQPRTRWFPDGVLFAPLHADPRWPHFNTGFRRIISGNDYKDVFYGNFGETFALYRNGAAFGGKWEVGIQAGAFTIFDQSSPSQSKDLVNADYRVGLMTSYRTGGFSAFARVQHHSSHLGDEYVLHNPGIQRINLSYEEADVKLSYELDTWLRIYGGGGMLVRKDPVDLGRGTAQYGVELTSPRTFFRGAVRPVAYADFQTLERTNWKTGMNVLAGLQFDNLQLGGRKAQLLAEFYDGPSPDGQFFTRQLQWIGVGVHLYF